MKKRIGIVTTGRSDFSSLLPIAKAAKNDPEVELLIYAGGMHLVEEFGHTIDDILNAGFSVAEKVDFLLASDNVISSAKSLGLGVIGFAEAFSRTKPDIIVIVGDRFEMLAIAGTALVFGIPIAHISGGDITEGAFDNQVRYAVSMMSHIHFTAIEEHRQRLIRMGEEEWRVVTSGDPAIDIIQDMRMKGREELESVLGMKLIPPVLVVSYHPVTLRETNLTEDVDSLLAALDIFEGTFIFTSPNADPGHKIITRKIESFVQSKANAKLFASLGQENYYSLLNYAEVMAGNSSSGIWEAPSFRLPAVNIGDRQRGRVRARNVIDVPNDKEAVIGGLSKALSPGFKESLKDLVNPYGSGDSSRIILENIKEKLERPNLMVKKYA